MMYRPKTLSNIALETLVKFSLVKVVDIRDRDNNFDTLISVARTIQNYVAVIPSPLINEFEKQLLKHSEECLYPKSELEQYFSIIFEIVLSPRLTRLCDRWMTAFCNYWVSRSCCEYRGMHCMRRFGDVQI